MLDFILNILCGIIHDVFIKHVYDIVRDKLSTFCVLMYPPSLNLKTGLSIAGTLESRGLRHYGVLYSSLFTDSRFKTLNT